MGSCGKCQKMKKQRHEDALASILLKKGTPISCIRNHKSLRRTWYRSFLRNLTSGKRHTSADKETPADNRVEHGIVKRSRRIDHNTNVDTGKRGNGHGWWCVELVVEGCFHPNGEAAEQKTGDGLHDYFSPEQRTAKLAQKTGHAHLDARMSIPSSTCRRLSLANEIGKHSDLTSSSHLLHLRVQRTQFLHMNDYLLFAGAGFFLLVEAKPVQWKIQLDITYTVRPRGV